MNDPWTNPLRDSEDRRLPRIAGPSVLVLFGVTGDLARKKLLPAIYDLANHGALPPGFGLVGFARRDWTNEQFLRHIEDSVREHARTPFFPEVWRQLSGGVKFVSGSFDEPEAFDRLKETLDRFDRDHGTGGNHAFYLSIPPKNFEQVIEQDHGLTGTTRARPGLREALAACRSGDTLVVTKLDRLARSVPDARDIVAELIASGVCLQLGASVHDPTDPVGRLLFNVLAMVAEFEADLIRARTREGMAVAKAKGRLRGKQPKLTPRQEAHLVSLARVGEHHARTGQALQRWPLHHLPGYPARRRSRFHCGHRALSPARGNPLGPPRAARPAPPPSVDRTPPHSDRSHRLTAPLSRCVSKTIVSAPVGRLSRDPRKLAVEGRPKPPPKPKPAIDRFRLSW